MSIESDIEQAYCKKNKGEYEFKWVNSNDVVKFRHDYPQYIHTGIIINSSHLYCRPIRVLCPVCKSTTTLYKCNNINTFTLYSYKCKNVECNIQSPWSLTVTIAEKLFNSIKETQ